jgi:23S rRNA pseudouridine2605 synthase
MARPRKSAGSSFGKRTDAENAFRKTKGKGGARGEEDKKRSGRGGFSKPSSSFRGKPDGERSFRSRPTSEGADRPRTSRPYGEGRGDEKRPYKRRDDSSSDRPKRFSSSGPRKSYGDSDTKRPYKKRDDSTSDRLKRFSKPDGERRSYGSAEGKRPYKKRDDSSSDRPSRFSKPDGDRRSYGSAEGKRPYKKRDDSSADRPRLDGDREEKKPFENRDSPSFSRRPRLAAGEKKPFKKGEERKSFVESRIENQKNAPRREPAEEKADDGLIRLNKFISNSGVCSRREADELIKMGLISVNGVTITEMGYKVKPTDEVRHEDKKLKAEKPVYVLLNKPKGFITTTDDPEERNTVMGLVASACKERIYPVGRLDRNTTGLLLLTNDGDLTDKLTHPSYNVKKIYKAELDKPITKADFQKIADGVHLEEGKAVVDDIAIVSDDNKTVGIEIHIGWNRIVRRIFESVGYEVVKLDRVVYAGLDKKDLKRGQWRFLKSDEIVRLKHFK